MISLSIAALLAMILYAGSQFLANQILLESRCGEFLRLMALSIPFSAIHACVNGYYYGMQRTRVPAASQITEQLIRMGVVLSPGPVFPGRANPHYHGTGRSGTPGRRNRFLLLRSAHLSDLRPYCFLTVSDTHLTDRPLHALRRP